MRVVDGGRHQRRRLAACVPEHQALVARPLVLVPGRIDALGDVTGLLVEVDLDGRAFPVESVLLVADVADHLARAVLDVLAADRLGTSHLSGDHDEVRRAQGLAPDARSGVGAEVQIDDGVGDSIADLVRMSFRDRLAREQVACHDGFLMMCRRWRCSGEAGEPDRLARWCRNQGAKHWVSSIFCLRFNRRGMTVGEAGVGFARRLRRVSAPRPLRGSRAPCPPIRSPSRARPGTSGGSPR